MLQKFTLFTPGPTPLPDRVREALARPMVNHRSEDFKKIIEDVRGRLKRVFGTQEEVAILTASGTGAMEACVVSLLKKSDRVLTVDAGKFGQRFTKLCKAHGLATDVITTDWGKAITLAAIEKAFAAQSYQALCLQASETSTGTLHPIREIAAWLQTKSPQTLLIVDGITAVGAMKIPLDEWKIDALISGSQKAFMLPPGLAFVALSKKAQAAMNTADLPRFYFDLKREFKEIAQNQTAFTPAISLILGLQESLKMLENEGLENVFARHQQLAAAARGALQNLGLKIASESPSIACSAAFLPAGIDGKTFLRSIRKRHGFLIAGGQDQWEGKALRLSHLGYYTSFDLLNALVAIGMELKAHGQSPAIGKMTEAFLEAAPF